MQSSGGLTDAHLFQGKDAILSGPAGGIVGAVEVSRLAGFDRIIGFDMGGTSTDVTHYAGEYERAFVTEVAGVRLRAPMMRIHTVAAGGGSICTFDGARFRVGPESAGANPGPGVVPARRPADGHRLQRDGRQARSGALSARVRPVGRRAARRGRGAREVRRARRRRRRRRPAARARPRKSPTASSKIAVENMANAIKHISVRARLRRHRVHAVLLRRRRRAARVPRRRRARHDARVHPSVGRRAVGVRHGPRRRARAAAAGGRGGALGGDARRRPATTLARARGGGARRRRGAGHRRAAASRAGARCTSSTRAPTRRSRSGVDRRRAAIVAEFERKYRQQYGFLMPGKPLVVEAVAVEAIGRTHEREGRRARVRAARGAARADQDQPRSTPTARSATPPSTTALHLRPGDAIAGPAVIREDNATTVVEPGWRATLHRRAAISCSSASRRRGARTRSARPPTRSCSRCSTTCSWRSPSRWA